MDVGALRFHATLGKRKLTLTYHLIATQSGDANTAELREHTPTGESVVLHKRAHVSFGVMSGESPMHRFHPRGGASGNDSASRYQKMHWPKVDTKCWLQPQDVRVGEVLNLWGMDVRITSAADQATRTWLERHGLPGASHNTQTLQSTAREDAAYAAASNTAAGAMYGGEVGAVMQEREAAAATRHSSFNPEHDELCVPGSPNEPLPPSLPPTPTLRQPPACR